MKNKIESNLQLKKKNFSFAQTLRDPTHYPPQTFEVLPSEGKNNSN